MIEPAAPPSSQTLARLRAGFAQMPPRSGAAFTDPEQIWAAVHGAVDAEGEPDREALIDRLHEDPQLALEWRLAAAMGPIEIEDTPAMPQRRTESVVRGSAPRWASVSTIVGVAVAAAAALALWMATPPPESTLTPASEPALRAPQAQPLLQTTLAAEHPLPRTDFRVHWSCEIEGASTFTLRVTTQALEPIYEAHDLTSPTARVPAAALASVPSGTVLLWRVEAIEPSGRRHASEVWELAVQ